MSFGGAENGIFCHNPAISRRASQSAQVVDSQEIVSREGAEDGHKALMI
jgi:hypothetical protein